MKSPRQVESGVSVTAIMLELSTLTTMVQVFKWIPSPACSRLPDMLKSTLHTEKQKLKRLLPSTQTLSQPIYASMTCRDWHEHKKEDCTKGHRRLTNQGVSLLELMIVLAILGALITMAQPSLRGILEHKRREEVYSTFIDAIREGRNLARRSMREVTITLSPTQLSLNSTYRNDVLELDPPYKEIILSNGQNSFVFDEQGGLESITPLTLTLKEEQGKIRSITLYPATGALRASE